MLIYIFIYPHRILSTEKSLGEGQGVSLPGGSERERGKT
jgi:hypothetical protein